MTTTQLLEINANQSQAEAMAQLAQEAEVAGRTTEAAWLREQSMRLTAMAQES